MVTHLQVVLLFLNLGRISFSKLISVNFCEWCHVSLNDLIIVL